MTNSVLSDYRWPSRHEFDQRELKYLKLALEEEDWSHTELCRQFEVSLANFLGVNYCLLVPNGTFAIYLGLLAAGIEKGQEVIVPGITWPSVIYAIIRAGGVPKTVDISTRSFCMDLNAVSEAISDQTFALLATHLFGAQCDMLQLTQLAERRGITVIEDAAQSLGSSQFGRRCGTWGKVGAFSLNDKKVLACGEGGCLVTDSEKVFEEAKRLQLIQPTRDRTAGRLPGTYKVSEFQGAVALAQLEKFPMKLAQLDANATLLNEYLNSKSGGRIEVQQNVSSVDIQSYYNFCFALRDGSCVESYRKNLGIKTNLKVSGPYPPLANIDDFRSLDPEDDRHTLSNIRIRHAACEEAYRKTCVRLPFNALLAPKEIIPMLGAEIIGALDAKSAICDD